MAFKSRNHTVNRLGGAGAGYRGKDRKDAWYDQSSEPQFDLGEKIELSDGRCFRYCYFSAAANRGLVVGPNFSVGGMVEISDGTVGTDAVAGSNVVTLTAAGSSGPDADFQGVTANQFEGAYLHITDADGEGFTYRIKSHGAASSDAVEFTLFDPLVTALDTASGYTTDWAISPNPYNNVIATDMTHTAVVNQMVTGITMTNVTSGYYAWVQSRGIGTALADGATVIGQAATCSDGVAGAIQVKDAETEITVGYCLTVVGTGEHAPIMISIPGIDG